MTHHRNPRRAAVLAAALHSWTATTSDPHPTEPVARLVVRQAPDWEHISTDTLTGPQVGRLLDLLRADLARPGPCTPVQAVAQVDQILAEWRAEGRTVVHPQDWIDVLPRVGRGRDWLAVHLVHLTDAGYLRETRRPGTYRL